MASVGAIYTIYYYFAIFHFLQMQIQACWCLQAYDISYYWQIQAYKQSNQLFYLAKL